MSPIEGTPGGGRPGRWARRAGAALLAVATALPARGAARAQDIGQDAGTIAVVGGYLIDGTGGPPIPDAVVLAEDGRITRVGTVDDTEVPPDAEVVDASGRTVMPGLTDAHVHLFIVGHGDYAEYFRRYHADEDRMREMMAISARELIDAGVTSARDVGAALDDALWIKEEIERGRLPGPRLFVSGPFLQKSTGPLQAFFRWTVDGADDARDKARRLVDRGVDVLKVIQLGQLTPGERRAVADVAHSAGVPIAVHAWLEEEHRMAAEMGAATIEHLGAGPRHTDQFTDASVRLLAESGVAVVPTMVVSKIYEITQAFPERLDHPRLAEDLPDDVHRDVRSSLEHPSRLGYFAGKRKVMDGYGAMVRKLHDGGVALGVGTDSGTPMNFHYESTWQEMRLLVETGLSPMEVIQMATLGNARLFGAADDIGSVEPGKLADLIVVDGNPLVEMSALHPANVVHVLKGGELVR